LNAGARRSLPDKLFVEVELVVQQEFRMEDPDEVCED
jgi:hypothetical protein